MKARTFFLPIATAMAALVFASAAVKADEPPPPQVVEVDVTVQGKTAAQWHAIAARYRRQMIQRWQPTVTYALRLASAVYGVSYWQLRTVSYCESRHYPFAHNGKYLGIFQLGWRPFGLFSPFDPVANALSAAATVAHDGSWRQWECKP
jgi:hypothetical protein